MPRNELTFAMSRGIGAEKDNVRLKATLNAANLVFQPHARSGAARGHAETLTTAGFRHLMELHPAVISISAPGRSQSRLHGLVAAAAASGCIGRQISLPRRRPPAGKL